MFTFVESPSFTTALAELWTDAEYAGRPNQESRHLFYVYTKGEITDLSSEQKKRLLAAVAEIKAQFQP